MEWVPHLSFLVMFLESMIQCICLPRCSSLCLVGWYEQEKYVVGVGGKSMWLVVGGLLFWCACLYFVRNSFG